MELNSKLGRLTDWFSSLYVSLNKSSQPYIIRYDVLKAVHIQQLRIRSDRQELTIGAETRCPDRQRVRTLVNHVEL